jgi:hypothetical protein
MNYIIYVILLILVITNIITLIVYKKSLKVIEQPKTDTNINIYKRINFNDTLLKKGQENLHNE